MKPDDAIMAFLFIAVFAMVLLGVLTRSLSGAFLGLTMVCFAVTAFLFNEGGLSIIGGIGMGILSLLSMLLTAALGINISFSSVARYHTDGTIDRASHTIMGKGAEQSYARWGEPQLGSGAHDLLGDGR